MILLISHRGRTKKKDEDKKWGGYLPQKSLNPFAHCAPTVIAFIGTFSIIIRV